MANDDESVYRSARAAAASTHKRLDHARKQVSSAGSAFGGGVGFWSWGTVGEKVAKRETCTKRYKELQAALKAAEAAIGKAQSACDALTRATEV